MLFTEINAAAAAAAAAAEMLIVSGKSHCCNDTFTDVRFTSLLAKKI